MINNVHQIKYTTQEFPECYVAPCNVFYDICNIADLESKKCIECYSKNNFNKGELNGN